VAKLVLNDASVRKLDAPARGNRIDYDVPKGPRDNDFVRGFAVRVTAAGRKTFLLVYVTDEGRERRQKIGDFGPLTVSAARDMARTLRNKVASGADPFAEQRERRAEADAARTKDAATLGGLLGAYVALLKRKGKATAGKVEGEIERTVRVPFKTLWKAPAASVTLDDLTRITAKLARAGKWRQAEKTRSYLRAAYTAAVSARGNTTAADLFEGFEHVENVARDLATIDRPGDINEARPKRALSQGELAAYWQRIKDMPAPHGALLRFHLLTGAQRCDQLARLSRSDYSADDKTVTLWDTKGRRKQPRRHVVPLVPEAETALLDMAGDAGPLLFTLDGGAHGAVYHTVRSIMLGVAEEMVKAEEAEATFTPGELRITVETRLAGAGVSLEVRAQLQSHGLGGVQNRHYDRHDYTDEKRAALETLRRLVSKPTDTVTPFRRKANKRRAS